MAKKTFELQLDEEYPFKKPLHGTSPTTVREALKWIEGHSTEGEDGEVEVPSVEYLLIYAVRRMVALHKDQKRHDSGKLADRRYAPRVDQLERKPPKLAALVEGVHSTQEKKPEAKAAPKPAKKATPKVKKPKAKKPAERKPDEAPPPPPGDAGNPQVGSVL
jgi:outer membrane biosynthesis protein TonB